MNCFFFFWVLRVRNRHVYKCFYTDDDTAACYRENCKKKEHEFMVREFGGASGEEIDVTTHI